MRLSGVTMVSDLLPSKPRLLNINLIFLLLEIVIDKIIGRFDILICVLWQFIQFCGNFWQFSYHYSVTRCLSDCHCLSGDQWSSSGVSPPLILGFFLNSPDILKYFFLDIFVELYERYAPGCTVSILICVDITCDCNAACNCDAERDTGHWSRPRQTSGPWVSWEPRPHPGLCCLNTCWCNLHTANTFCQDWGSEFVLRFCHNWHCLAWLLSFLEAFALVSFAS